MHFRNFASSSGSLFCLSASKISKTRCSSSGRSFNDTLPRRSPTQPAAVPPPPPVFFTPPRRVIGVEDTREPPVLAASHIRGVHGLHHQTSVDARLTKST